MVCTCYNTYILHVNEPHSKLADQLPCAGEPNTLQPSDNGQASKTASRDVSSKADVITKARAQGSSKAAATRPSTARLTLPAREVRASRQQRSGYSTAASARDGFQGGFSACASTNKHAWQ